MYNVRVCLGTINTIMAINMTTKMKIRFVKAAFEMLLLVIVTCVQHSMNEIDKEDSLGVELSGM